MATQELKIARIGNSRGVRLPAAALQRYGMEGAVIMEERSDGILLRPLGPAPHKLSWEETAKAMAASGEDWSEFAALDADGLDTVPWEAQEESGKSAAEPRRSPTRRKRSRR